MNYVTLNGVKSTTIKGLLIQSLPSISKPLIRTEVEEIDGRDGDIVTKLGYSAYDREMSIGLYGDYNIDDVISFFDSEGVVTFSNEPDKYYNYQILDQIDFERLIKFKKATITFHVQPFKYSTVDLAYKYSNQYLGFSEYSETKNGITLTAQNGIITITGTATEPTEIYLPVKVNLQSGNYTLRANTIGTDQDRCAIRLIQNAPSNLNTFGGQPLYLDDGEVTISDSLSQDKSYNYIWFYIQPNVAMDFNIVVWVSNDDFNSITLFNKGNTVSKPTLTLHGSGTINISLNDVQAFVVDLDVWNYITIDVNEMNAYQDDVLMNRYVTGDYDNLIFKMGKNILSWTGNVSEIEVEDYSRWI